MHSRFFNHELLCAVHQGHRAEEVHMQLQEPTEFERKEQPLALMSDECWLKDKTHQNIYLNLWWKKINYDQQVLRGNMLNRF